MCDSPSLFILSVLCVVVSISGRLYFCIFSCDPLLFLSGVLCPSPQAIGALLFLHAVSVSYTHLDVYKRQRLYILILFFPVNSLYPALMLFSPERTSCFSFSLFESNIFFPLKYVSVDTPAVSANLARTSILFLESTVVEEICEKMCIRDRSSYVTLYCSVSCLHSEL